MFVYVDIPDTAPAHGQGVVLGELECNPAHSMSLSGVSNSLAAHISFLMKLFVYLRVCDCRIISLAFCYPQSLPFASAHWKKYPVVIDSI